MNHQILRILRDTDFAVSEIHNYDCNNSEAGAELSRAEVNVNAPPLDPPMLLYWEVLALMC